MKELLKHGVNINSRNDNDETPLNIATKKGHTEIVEILTKLVDDPNPKDLSNMTPLHEAAENGHLETVKLLMSFDIDSNSIDDLGKTPYLYASENGHTEIATLLANRNEIRGQKRKSSFDDNENPQKFQKLE